MLYARHSLISLEPHGTALPTKDTGSKEPISSHGGHELEQVPHLLTRLFCFITLSPTLAS